LVHPVSTGKTTFLGKQVRSVIDKFSGGVMGAMYPNPVLICSLTRAAAAEVAGRDLPLPKTAIGTLHSHCFRALRLPQIIGPAEIELWNSTSPYPLGASDFVDNSGDSEETSLDRRADVNIVTDGDAYLQRIEILRHRMIPEDEWDSELRDFYSDWRTFKRERNVVDFTDLIENAIQQVPIAPGTPAVIMVDEAQDLSALEYSLIKIWSESARATIVVGDPWQSLYTWRGSDPGLFSDPSVPADHRRVLSQSYRVPANILKVALAWVKDHLSTYEPIEYAARKEPIADDDDIAGEMGWREGNINETDELIEEALAMIETGRSVMFQASCSYMLSGLVANLRNKNIPFCNPWRKWRRDWNPFVVASNGATAISRLLSFVRPCEGHPHRGGWTVKDAILFVAPMAVTGLLRRGAKKRIEGLDDKDESTLTYGLGATEGQVLLPMTEEANIYESDDRDETTTQPLSKQERESELIGEEDLEDWFEPSVLPDIVAIWSGKWSAKDAALWWQKHLLASPKKIAEYPVGVLVNHGIDSLTYSPRIFVGTIHSFKGAEANTTYIFPDLSGAGTRQWEAGSGLLRDEVVRLFYVAMTRAKEKAFICRWSSSNCCPIRRYVQKFDFNAGASDAPVVA